DPANESAPGHAQGFAGNGGSARLVPRNHQKSNGRPLPPDQSAGSFRPRLRRHAGTVDVGAAWPLSAERGPYPVGKKGHLSCRQKELLVLSTKEPLIHR